VPAWVVGAVLGGIVVAVVAYFVARHRRLMRSRRYDSIAPASSKR